MSADRQKKLVDLLIEKTSRKEIAWEANFRDDQFQARFGPTTIEMLLTSSNRNINPDVVIRILNENGTIVDTFSDITMFEATGQVYYEKMKKMYDTAQRQISGADDILDDLLQALSQ